jgi:hypothetical protein
VSNAERQIKIILNYFFFAALWSKNGRFCTMVAVPE